MTTSCTTDNLAASLVSSTHESTEHTVVQPECQDAFKSDVEFPIMAEEIVPYEWDISDVEPALVTASARLSSWVYTAEHLASESIGMWEINYSVVKETRANDNGQDTQKAVVVLNLERACASRSKRVLVFVYRGSVRLQDWMQSIACVENRVRFREYHLGVHSGILTYVENDFFEHGSASFDMLDAEYRRGTSLVLFVGHSLGGGMASVAQVLNFLAAEHPDQLPCYEQEARGLQPGAQWLLRSSRCITFAAPMSFAPVDVDSNIEKILQKQSLAFVHNNDIVPRLPGHLEFVEQSFSGCGRVQINLVGVPTFVMGWTIDVRQIATEFARGAPASCRYRHLGMVVLFRSDGTAYQSTAEASKTLLLQKHAPTSNSGVLDWWSDDAYDAGMDHLIARYIDALPWRLRFQKIRREVGATRNTLTLTNRGLTDADLFQLSSALSQVRAMEVLDVSRNKFGDFGVEYLVQVLQQSLKLGARPLRILTLSWNSIQDRCMESVANYLMVNPYLEELHLDGTWIGQLGAICLARVLCENPNLKVLQLAGDMFSTSRIQDVGGIAIVSALQANSNLRKLALARCRLTKLTADALAVAIRKNTTLRELWLCENDLGDDGAASLAESLTANCTLVELDLSSNSISCVGIQGFSSSLMVSQTLQTLVFADNLLWGEGMEVLAEAMGRVDCLRNLSLSFTGTRPSCVDTIAQILYDSTSIERLLLVGNELGDEGTKELAVALIECPSLLELQLGSNRIGDVGAIAIAAILQGSKSLHTLDLADNCIGDAGARAFAKALTLQSCGGLSFLFLNGNHIGDAGADAFLNAMDSCCIEELHLSGNPISNGAVTVLNGAASNDDEWHANDSWGMSLI